MNNSNNPKTSYSLLRESSLLIIGELIVSLIVIGIYLILQQFFPENEIFSYRIITGVILGGAVTLANFLILSISVNKAIDGFMKKRGDAEMNDEQAYEFAQNNATAVQNAATRSYLIRMVSMLATLIIAFFLDWFDPIATAVPLLMFRPILYVTELIKGKKR